MVSKARIQAALKRPCPTCRVQPGHACIDQRMAQTGRHVEVDAPHPARLRTDVVELSLLRPVLPAGVALVNLEDAGWLVGVEDPDRIFSLTQAHTATTSATAQPQWQFLEYAPGHGSELRVTELYSPDAWRIWGEYDNAAPETLLDGLRLAGIATETDPADLAEAFNGSPTLPDPDDFNASRPVEVQPPASIELRQCSICGAVEPGHRDDLCPLRADNISHAPSGNDNIGRIGLLSAVLEHTEPVAVLRNRMPYATAAVQETIRRHVTAQGATVDSWYDDNGAAEVHASLVGNWAVATPDERAGLYGGDEGRVYVKATRPTPTSALKVTYEFNPYYDENVHIQLEDLTALRVIPGSDLHGRC